MNLTFILRSILIGFTLAAAVGPIWMLVMQRTLARGWVVGMVSGLGVAAADALFGLAGGLGLTAIATALSDYSVWLRVIGGLVLIFLGFKIFISKQGENRAGDEQVEAKGLLMSLVSIFLLTLANPLTIFSFAAVYTGIGADSLELGANSAWVFAGSIFMGSELWWLALVSGVNLLRGRLNLELISWINRLAGAVIVIFGISVLF